MEYKAKTLFSGIQLGYHGDNNKYVTIPERKFNMTGNVVVEYNGEYQRFELDNSKLVRTFKDKFREGKTYNLVYFKWQDNYKI